MNDPATTVGLFNPVPFSIQAQLAKKIKFQQKIIKKQIQKIKKQKKIIVTQTKIIRVEEPQVKEPPKSAIVEFGKSFVASTIVKLGQVGQALGIVSPKFRPPEPSWPSREFHAPGHNFLGPGTNYLLRIQRGDQPTDFLDACAMAHDAVYARTDLTAMEATIADQIFLNCVNSEQAKGFQLLFKFISSQVFEAKKLFVMRGIIDPRLGTATTART